MPEMAARTLRLCLPPQKTPHAVRLLQEAHLIVVFLCEKYAEKQWCGLEWRAIRDLIKLKLDDQLMLVRFDDAQIEGVFSLDGYIDARVHEPRRLAEFILQRVHTSTS